MKTMAIAATLMIAAVIVPANAQVCPNAGRCPAGMCAKNGAPMACDTKNCSAANCRQGLRGRYQTVIRKDARGNPVAVTLTGKYSDCISGSVRMGYTAERAKRYCDSRPGLD